MSTKLLFPVDLAHSAQAETLAVSEAHEKRPTLLDPVLSSHPGVAGSGGDEDDASVAKTARVAINVPEARRNSNSTRRYRNSARARR